MKHDCCFYFTPFILSIIFLQLRHIFIRWRRIENLFLDFYCEVKKVRIRIIHKCHRAHFDTYSLLTTYTCLFGKHWCIHQCFPNFFESRTIKTKKKFRGPQNFSAEHFRQEFTNKMIPWMTFSHILGSKKFSQTNLGILADHKWSADRSLGNTDIHFHVAKCKGPFK